MKEVFLALSVAVMTQTAFAEIDLSTVVQEHNFSVTGTTNLEFAKKPCVQKLDELFDIHEKVFYMDGGQSLLISYKEQKRIVPESQEHIDKHIQMFEKYRRMGMDELSYKKYLFGLDCHVQKNPTHKTTEVTEP